MQMGGHRMALLAIHGHNPVLMEMELRVTNGGKNGFQGDGTNGYPWLQSGFNGNGTTGDLWSKNGFNGNGTIGNGTSGQRTVGTGTNGDGTDVSAADIMKYVTTDIMGGTALFVEAGLKHQRYQDVGRTGSGFGSTASKAYGGMLVNGLKLAGVDQRITDPAEAAINLNEGVKGYRSFQDGRKVSTAKKRCY